MSRWLVLGVWVASLAMIAVGLTLVALVPAGRAPSGATLGDLLPLLPLVLSAASIGALIGWQRPGNRLGWLIALLGLFGGVEMLLAGYAMFGLFSLHPLALANVAAWAFSWSGTSLALCGNEIVFAFPNGPLDLSRTRIGRACGVLGTIVFGLGIAILPGALFNIPVQNPFGWAGAEAAAVALLAVAGILFACTITLAASSLWERYRTAEHREQLQIKWFLAAVCFAAVASLGALALALVDFRLARTASALAVAAIPVAIANAILRHQLYDIDVLISRALVYGATTVGIAIAFFGGIVVLQAILRPITSGSEFAVAAATLVSFALFQPLRRRIQAAVDRRFYRSRYDAARTLDAFSVRLRDEVDLDAVRAELVAAVRETMQPAAASVWIRP